MAISVLIATVEPLLSDGIDKAISAESDLSVASEVNNPSEIMTQIDRLKPDVALIDFHLLEPNAFQIIEHIKRKHPKIDIIILVDRTNPSCLRRCLQAGTAGYVLKKARAHEFVDAVRSVHNGRAVVGLTNITELIQFCDVMAKKVDSSKGGHHISSREIDVLKLAGKGLTNRQIAKELNISERTVQSYFGAIFNKLAVGSRAEAVLTAWRHGWMAEDDFVDQVF
jgi:DNA-binding NarL/FixJ family response regulator